jgi:hypothetical protein
MARPPEPLDGAAGSAYKPGLKIQLSIATGGLYNASTLSKLAGSICAKGVHRARPKNTWPRRCLQFSRRPEGFINQDFDLSRRLR